MGAADRVLSSERGLNAVVYPLAACDYMPASTH